MFDHVVNMAECRHLENCQIGAGFLNCSTLLTNGNLSNLYSRWSNFAKFLPLVRARIVSGHLTENGQFFDKMQKFKFFTSSPLKMRACGTGRKFAEYDQHDYDEKRIKWNVDLTLLKRITSEIFRLEGKWSSPGGKRKKFESSNTDLSFTWYPDKQNSLIFQGRGVTHYRMFA